MNTRKLKVYTASKLTHGPMWVNLNWPEIEIVARWPLRRGYARQPRLA